MGHGVGQAQAATAEPLRGRVIRTGANLFDYDYEQALLGEPVTASVTMDDRLDEITAKRELIDLRAHFGFGNVEPNNKLAFDRGLFVCMALNGSSRQAPGSHASFTVPGFQTVYYKDVLDRLLEPRKFFRAFAEPTELALAYYLSSPGRDTYAGSLLYSKIMTKAKQNQLGSYPTLIADNADALNLSSHKFLAVQASKQLVLNRANGAEPASSSRQSYAKVYDASQRLDTFHA